MALCTVVVGDRDASGAMSFKAVNACIQFLPTLDGRALFTVEDLRQPDGSLHPVQQSLVDYHGSQCGFCTPGFVMSMWSLYEKHGHATTASCSLSKVRTVPSREEIANALTGESVPLHRLPSDHRRPPCRCSTPPRRKRRWT